MEKNLGHTIIMVKIKSDLQSDNQRRPQYQNRFPERDIGSLLPLSKRGSCGN
jgi:hypothetical protein